MEICGKIKFSTELIAKNPKLQANNFWNAFHRLKIVIDRLCLNANKYLTRSIEMSKYSLSTHLTVVLHLVKQWQLTKYPRIKTNGIQFARIKNIYLQQCVTRLKMMVFTIVSIMEIPSNLILNHNTKTKTKSNLFFVYCYRVLPDILKVGQFKWN